MSEEGIDDMKFVTGDDVLAHPEWEPCELVRGRVISLRHAGALQGKVAAKILTRIGVFAEARCLGEVFTSETGFYLERDPDTVRGPDAMFLSKARIPPGGICGGFLPVVPDLAVEVVSPWDTLSKQCKKAQDYIDGGVPLVWVLDPDSRTARPSGAAGPSSFWTHRNRSPARTSFRDSN